MTMIVVVVVVLLGGLSGNVISQFRTTSSALSDNDDSPVADSKNQPAADIAGPQEVDDISKILIRFGIFAAVVFTFMAYTTTFVAKAEGGSEENKSERPPRKDENSHKQHSLADFLLDRRSQIGRAIRNHTDSLDSNELTVEMFMSQKPVTANINDSLADVMKLMRNRGFRHMLVVGQDNSIAGIISDRDLPDSHDAKLSEIMTSDPITVETTTSINIAITLLVKNRISALPVIHESELVGVLTSSDLLVTLQCLMLNIQQQLIEART